MTCNLGVGCDESGVCYARAHDEPERCPHYVDDREEPFEPECERCHGDGMDPWNDYLLPCPLCQGEQRP